MDKPCVNDMCARYYEKCDSHCMNYTHLKIECLKYITEKPMSSYQKICDFIKRGLNYFNDPINQDSMSDIGQQVAYRDCWVAINKINKEINK